MAAWGDWVVHIARSTATMGWKGQPVSGGEGFRIRAHTRLEPIATSARMARRFVLETLAGWGDEASMDCASLLVSELVTNAIVHARSAVELELSRDADADVLRVAVRDASVRPPRMGGFDLEALSGRGLALVEALSDRWGVEADASGKLVWFELTSHLGSHLQSRQTA